MKKVFSSHLALCHEWAHQTQSKGRASRMFFEGPSLYSYGKHYEIARVVYAEEETMYLLADGKYSSSTSKHRSKAIGAIPQYFLSVVHCFGSVCSDQSEGAYYALEEIDAKYDKAIKKGKYLKQAINIIKKYNIISKYLPVNFPHSELAGLIEKFKARVVAFDFQAYYAKEVQAEAKREAKRKEREAEQRRINMLEYAEKIELWKKGINVQLGWSVSLAYLRIKGDHVQTSKGVTIPKNEAKRLFDFILSFKGEGNFKVDNRFSLNSITENEVIIGCHTIEMTEIKRVGEQL